LLRCRRSVNIAAELTRTLPSEAGLSETSKKRLIFIAGAEGSGTTLLRRLLAAPECCACIGRDIAKMPDHPEAQPLLASFERISQLLWDRAQPMADRMRAQQDWARTGAALASSPAFADVSHFIVKRSYQFGGIPYRYCPDVCDLFDLPFETRIVAIYRDPCAATYSALRRGFDTDLYRLAARAANFLAVLAGQVRSVEPDRRHLLSYASLCAAPGHAFGPLARFCELPEAPIRAAAQAEGLLGDADRRYAEELPPNDIAWLEGYFNARRRAQWDILEEGG
jgi:hypothetical protein